MEKYIVEVRQWVKQVRPSGRSGEHEMTLEEAEDLIKRLIDQGMNWEDTRIRDV